MKGGFKPRFGGGFNLLDLLAGVALGKSLGNVFGGLIQWLNEPSSSEHRLCMPQQYWYDPEEDRVVLSDIPPNSKSTPVLSIYDPKEAKVDLRDLREEYIQQEKDAFNPAYRKDSGTYSTSQKRIDRQNFYDGQIPTINLKKLHRKMATLNNQNPNNQGLSRSNGVLRTPSWLPVVTPDRFSYTTVITTNYATQGLLHSLIRHGDQFVQNGLSSDINGVLPAEMQPLVTQLRSRNDNECNTMFTTMMLSMEDNYFQGLRDLQIEAHKLIQKIVTQDNYLGECVNTNGQQQVYFKVNSSTVMVLALSEELYLGQADCDTKGRKRPIRKIITVFFTKMEDVDTKRRNNWPVTKKQ